MSFLEIGRDLSGTRVPALPVLFLVWSFWLWQPVDVFSLEGGGHRLSKPGSSYPCVIVWDRHFLNDQHVYMQTRVESDPGVKAAKDTDQM